VINVTADNVIRMLSPLVMTPAEGRMVVERLARWCRTSSREAAARRRRY